MAAFTYNPEKFLNDDSFTAPTFIAGLKERFQEIAENTVVQDAFINKLAAGNINRNFLNILQGKKIDSQDRVISEQQAFNEEVEAMIYGGSSTSGSYGNSNSNSPNDNSSDAGIQSKDSYSQVQAVVDTINYEAKVKFLQMYFDAYMAPKVSDSQWRLGPVTGTVLETDFEDNIGTVTKGMMYTRSQFNFEYYRKFWADKTVSDKKEIYSQYGFPPYKISASNRITDKTNIMDTIRVNRPNASFDQDNFLLSKEGFTYRDPGFKSISDNINYIQWLAEQCTGVVSTYLTEWDLSVYMQEKLMSATINGTPLKLFLNYRIKEDNPFAHDQTNRYIDDRALVFNAVGNAVSKIEENCRKIWRPSDFPTSAYWLPYMEKKDYELKDFEVDQGENKDPLLVPYMDLYDNLSTSFDYKNSNVKDIMRNQDFLGAALGVWPNFKMKYYNIFYTNDGDALTDWDVQFDGWLKKVSGADSGVAEEMNKDLDSFIEKTREEMLCNFGYYGSPTPAGSTGGLYNRMMMKDAMADGGGGGGNITFSSAKSRRSAGANDALSNVDLDNLNDTSAATATLQSGLETKADASNMAKFTGINRFSPPIFGGPHGSDYNPNTLQAYFDTKSTFWRNIPRISANNSEYFSSLSNNEYFTDVNAFYSDKLNTGCSPNKSLAKLKQGMFAAWSYSRGITRRQVTTLIEGKIEYNHSTKRWDKYTFPEYSPQHEEYNYSGEYIFRTKTKEYKRNPWNPFTWEYDYKSYENNQNVVSYRRSGFYYYFTVSYQTVWRLSTHYVTGLFPFKQYYLNDEPDVKWQIVHHTFDNYTASANMNESFWQAAKESNEYKEPSKESSVFILKFFDTASPVQDYTNAKGETSQVTAIEQQIMRQMIASGRGINPTTELFFCQGNESKRYTEGPESIFKAKCSLRFFENFDRVITIKKILWWTKKEVKETVWYVPYIAVDIPNVTYVSNQLLNGPIFEEAITTPLITNMTENGSDVPIHMKSSILEETESHNPNILHKFTMSGQRDIMMSSRKEKIEQEGGLLSGILGGIIGTAIAAIGAYVVAAVITTVFFPIGTLVGTILVSSLGAGAIAGGVMAGIAASRVPKYVSDSFGQFISESYTAISGIGILSNIQGLEPNIEELKDFSSPNYNFRAQLKLPDSAKSMPIKDIPFKTFKYSSVSSFEQEISKGRFYWTTSSPSLSTTKDMDAGLRNALTKIYTRAIFVAEKQDFPLAYPGTLIDISIGFRNFLSVLLTQSSYLQFAKDTLVETIDFDILRKALLTCVDKCVIKANGMLHDGTLVDEDNKHVLYNYWVHRAIQLFGDRSKYIEIKNNLKAEFTRKITLYNTIIDQIRPIIEKETNLWSYNEIVLMYNLIYSVKDETKKSIIDDFFFSYLNILYNYRFFFIAKRFNKEDGSMWIMRALESILEFIVPPIDQNNPPPSPSKMMKTESQEKVAFFELQNTTSQKQQAFIHGIQLPEDRINKLYIKVKWVTKREYDKWLEYDADKNNVSEVNEVLRIITPTGIIQYAEKPLDGSYTLNSKEKLENEKNKKWNLTHPNEIPRVVEDYDDATWTINWGDSPDLTPIKWNVFNNINATSLLEYAKESLSPEDLICLVEENSDFWTVNIPENIWPRKFGYFSSLTIKLYNTDSSTSFKNDSYITLLGPMAYSIYPITSAQERAMPGPIQDLPDIHSSINSTDGFNQTTPNRS